MEIERGKRVYTRTKNEDVFQEWTLTSTIVSLTFLQEEQRDLEEFISTAPDSVEYPREVTEGQREAIDAYNVAMTGRFEEAKKELIRLEDLVKLLKELPEGGR